MPSVRPLLAPLKERFERCWGGFVRSLQGADQRGQLPAGTLRASGLRQQQGKWTSAKNGGLQPWARARGQLDLLRRWMERAAGSIVACQRGPVPRLPPPHSAANIPLGPPRGVTFWWSKGVPKD